MALPAPSHTRIATLFGIGNIPFAPGTFASAAALPVGWWIALLGGWQSLLIASGLLTLVGIWACDRHARPLSVHDPQECVIDEAAGQWLALIPVVLAGRLHNALAIALAFVFFRALDIFKPWPIPFFERMPGGLGIMMDDVAAGIGAGALVAACVALHIIT